MTGVGLIGHFVVLSRHVATMLRTINRRYDKPLSLELFARTLGRERGYLGRLFKKEVGCSMREYLARVRVRRAAELIRQGTKIEAVILEVGYRSPKRFYDAFKQEYGVTPAAFRGLPPGALSFARKKRLFER
jgi:YesN/AraC family two-component response regulator